MSSEKTKEEKIESPVARTLFLDSPDSSQKKPVAKRLFDSPEQISQDTLPERQPKRKRRIQKLPSVLSDISRNYIINDNNEIDLVINEEEKKIDLSNSINNINRSLRTYDYEIENYISSGSYGSVYTAKKISEGNTNYVIKIIINKESFIDEINILSYLLNKCGNCESCPEFICFVQGFEFNNLRLIVYKNAGVSLKTFIESNLNLPNNTKLSIATQFATQLKNAINRLHSEFNIFHGDIKDTNITIFTNQDGSLQLKLIDFGVSSNLGIGFDNWPNDENYYITENEQLSVNYVDEDLNKDNKIKAEMNVVKKLIKEKINDKLGIQADNFRMKYLKYKLKYLALKNKN